jgi:VCBS repeat-containing protein
MFFGEEYRGMTQFSADKQMISTTAIPKISTPFAMNNGGIDLAALSPSRRRAPTKVPANSTTFAERGAMLLPLLGLAACGGGGATDPGAPAGPPSGAGADTATITAAVRTAPAAATVTGNVITNDTPSTSTVSTVGGTTIAAGGTNITSSGLGTLNINSTGAYTFTAGGPGAFALKAGETGTASYSYTNSSNQTATLTVTVTGVNDAPIADAATSKGFAQNTPAGGVALGLLVSDPEGDTLTISLTPSLSNGGQLINGSTVLANGVAVTLTEAQFEALQVRVGAPGTAPGTFTYTVEDSNGAKTGPVTVTLAVRPPSVDLATLGAGEGATLTAGAAGSGFGTAIAGGGDVNGDGRVDVVVGSPGTANGAIQIFYGNAGNMSATSAATIAGANAGDRFGSSVAVSAGGGTSSVNGDARADIIVGAPSANINGTFSGSAYIIYGGSTIALPGSFAGASAGYVVEGPEQGNQFNGTNTLGVNIGANTGYFVAALGDTNADGRADFLISSPGQDNASSSLALNNNAGTVSIGYGSNTNPASPNIGNLGAFLNGGTLGENITTAAAGSELGATSFNGAGGSDIAIGSASRSFSTTTTGQGAVYVVMDQSASGGINTGGFNGTNGFTIIGAAANDRLGSSVAFGDVDGDGRADLIVGATGVNGHGAVYIIFGGTATGANLDLSTATFVNGLDTDVNGLRVAKIEGATSGQGFGSSVAFLGNFDGTGGDFAVGTNGGSGNAYVINGGTAVAVGGRSVATPNGSDVTLYDGPAGTAVVANVGDVNGGGQADLGIGIGGANAAYVIYAKSGTQVAASLSVESTGLNYNSSPSPSVDQLLNHFAGDTATPTASVSGTADFGMALPLSLQDTMFVSDTI